MHTYTGVPASTGIVVGPVEQIDHGTTGLHRIVCDPFRERALYDVAVVLAKDELRRLSQRAKGPDADILLFQIALLEDESFTNEIGDYIAAGAGGAAHLPGMVASMTTLPVVGVPVKSRALNGLDSLLSIVQMPAGVPVATTAINGAKNAALIAVSILALQDAELAARLEAFRAKQTADVLAAEL